MRNSKDICTGNPLQLCYLNVIKNNSILVWFTIEQTLNITFDSYRFVLRSIDHLPVSSATIEILTNFTELIDFNNSLRLINLDLGEHEICTEFRLNSTTFIFQPRDGCVFIQIGKSSHETSKQSPAPLLITLATAIVLFFILGLVVQWVKAKRSKINRDQLESRLRSSSTNTILSLRQQREFVVRKLFHRHFDEPGASRIRQWARNRAFRHRISMHDQDFDKPRIFRRRSKQAFTPTDRLSQPRSRTETISDDKIPSSESISTTNNISTVLQKEQYQMPPRKTTFHLSIPEEYEML